MTALGLALLVAALAMALTPAAVSYDFVRSFLLQFFRQESLSRHLDPRRFEVFWRASAAVLVVFAAGLILARRSLVRLAVVVRRSIELDLRHRRRHVSSNYRFSTEAAILAIITLCGVALRLRFIHRGIRLDEAGTVVMFASKPLLRALSTYDAPNNHLFHTLLVHFSIGLFGRSDWAVRLPAFTAGVLVLPLTYAFAMRFVNNYAGLIAAALVATSSTLIEYSVNARGYTLLCAFTLATAICAWELRKRVSPAWCVLLGLFALLGLWTIPIFLFPMGGTAIWLLWDTRDRS